jgi:hypothetical protein
MSMNTRIRGFGLRLVGAGLLSLALAGAAYAADAGSIGDNVKQLVREVKDPATPGKIKAHEQALEKKVKNKREHQRKDHGSARPADAVDLAKSLDKPDGAGTATPAAAKADAPKPETAKPETKKPAR